MRASMLLVFMGLIGCGGKVAPAKKDGSKPAEPVAAAPPAEPAVDPRNTNYQAGGGALQNVRQAAKRAAKMHDMDQLGTLIYAVELDTNKMPTASEIKTFLKKDAPHILKEIDEGVIILTDTKKKDGLWAYEIDADKAGGLVLVAGRVRRADAEEAKQLLSQK